MRFIIAMPLIVTLMLIVTTDDMFAQSSNQIETQMDELKSQDWRVRQEAAFGLINLPEEMKTDHVRKALIDELEREYGKIRKGDYEICLKCDDGGEQGYYSWLFENVAAMADDRAFPLFTRIGAPSALVRYGDKGIVVILDNLDYKDSGNLWAAITVLSVALKPKKVGYIAQGNMRERIKGKMIEVLKRNSHPSKDIELFKVRASERANIRLEVVRSLGYLAEAGDSAVLPLIKAAAEEDPYFLDMSKKKNYQGPQKKYMVREEAQKVLEGLKAKGIVK